MGQYGVPPTPLNYEIWYSYAAQSSPNLQRALDAWMESGAPFTAAFASELHKKFLDQTLSPQSFRELGERMGAEIERLTLSLEQAGRDTSSYGVALRGAAGVLGGQGDLSAMRQVIDNLLMATRHMDQRSRALEVRLSESTSEVRLLREDIETIRRQSLLDQLTGLANRRAFDDRLQESIESAREEGTPLSLLMGDIDYFKSFNDSWGHQTGDQVLRLVARCLTENTKGRDTAARYGGEEFAVILPSTTLEDAAKLADAIRRSVQSKKVVKRSTGATLGTITMSLGAATFHPEEAQAALIERADCALYAAKRAGRNCVRNERDPDVLSLLATNFADGLRPATSAA
jgi:diguanylate cyclase